MALVKFGTEIVGIRGHTAGLIYSQNKAGPYIKNFSTPVNPNSPTQQTQRSTLAIVSQTWRSLSAGQRLDWDEFAADPPETDYDPWGEPVSLSGHQWFTRINNRLTSAGAALLQDPPASTPQTPVTITNLVARDPGHLNTDSYVAFPALSFSDGSLPVITLALLYTPGRGFPTNYWRLAYCGPTTNAGTVPIGDVLATLFGDYPIDTALYATLCRQSITGIRSTKTTAQTTVIT